MGQPVIPDTTIFDLRKSAQGYRLNKLCGSLCDPRNARRSSATKKAYMARFRLRAGKAVDKRRDFAGMIHAGMNIYWMLKMGAVTGNSLYRMGAQMRGETYEQFLATRNFKDAV